MTEKGKMPIVSMAAIAGLVIVTVLASIIAVVMEARYSSINYTTVGSVHWGGASIGSIGLLFIAILVSMLMGKINPKYRATAALLCLLYAGIGPAIVSCGYADWDLASFWAIGAIEPYTTDLLKYAPAFWMPSDPAAYPLLLSGGPLNWAVWSTPVLTFTVMFVLWQLLVLSLAVVVRRQYIAYEKLPFPMGRMVSYPIKLSSEGSFFSWKKSKFFVIGMLFVLIWYQQWLFQPIAVRAFKMGSWFSLGQYIPTIDSWSGPDTTAIRRALPGAVIPLTTLFGLMFAGLLLPLDFLFSFSITYVVVQIVLNVLVVQAGLAPFDPSWSNMTTWAQYGYFVGPLRYAIVGWGMFLALGIMPFVIHRAHFADTLKLAIGRRVEGIAETEESPLPFRWAYLFFGAIFIAFLAFWIASGVPVGPSFIILLLLVVITLSQLRNIGECGMVLAKQYWAIGGSTYAMIGDLLTASGAGTGTAPLVSLWMMQSMVCDQRTAGGYTYLLADKIGSDSNVSSRKLFSMSLVGILATSLIVFPISIWFIHYAGGFYKVLGWSIWEVYDQGASVTPQVLNGFFPHSRPYAEHTIVGFILGAVLVYLRVMYPAFPINPWGVVNALVGHDNVYFFFPFLIAWIIKLLVIRVGGAKWYEEKLVPLAVGFVFLSFSMLFINAVESSVLTMAGY